MNEDELKWSYLVKIYQELDPSLRKSVTTKYLKFSQMDDLTTSLRRALTEEGVMIESSSPAIQEYEDILAEEKIFKELN